MSRYVYPAFPGGDEVNPNHQLSYGASHTSYADPNHGQAVAVPAQHSPIYPYHQPAHHTPLPPYAVPPPQSPSPAVGLRAQLTQAIQLEGQQSRKTRKTRANQTAGDHDVQHDDVQHGEEEGDAEEDGAEADLSAEEAADGHEPVENQNDEEHQGERRWYLAPPPEQTYDSYEECHAAMHEWNKAHGFDVSRQKPAKNKNGDIYKYLYQCTRHGRRGNKPKVAEGERKRKRESKKTGCSMGVYIRAVDVKNTAGKWRISHQQDERSKWHNHEGMTAEELTGHRRRNRTEEMKDLIRQTRAAGMDAWQSLAYIKDKIPGALITKQDVLNYRKQDPGPGSDMHNYLDRAYMLAISFEAEFEQDPVFGTHILTKLRSRMPISICLKPEALPAHIQKNPPRVIMVPDAAITYPAYRLQVARLVTYALDGGTVIFMGHFQSAPCAYINQLFLQHLNLDWQATSDTDTPIAYSLNDKLAAGGTGGRWVVVARNFAPGTDAKGIEQLVGLSPGNATLTSCRLYSQHPIVVAELIFSTQEGAESVINTFSGKAVNLGRIATAEGRELEFTLRAPAPVATGELQQDVFVKANYLTGVAVEDTVYAGSVVRDVHVHAEDGGQNNAYNGHANQWVATAAAAYTKMGKGFVGYVGMSEFDDNYLRTVAAMCHF